MPKKSIPDFFLMDETIFIAKFLTIFFFLYFILISIDISPILEFIASFEHFALRLLGIEANISSTSIFVSGTQLRIVSECSGFFMVILLAALLWSTKIENRRRIKYLLFFSPLLLIFNLLRLLMTILALTISVAAFDLTHIFLWFVDSAIVLAIWMHAQGYSLPELLGNKDNKKKAGYE